MLIRPECGSKSTGAYIVPVLFLQILLRRVLDVGTSMDHSSQIAHYIYTRTHHGSHSVVR
jgi:hypothetical protein